MMLLLFLVAVFLHSCASQQQHPALHVSNYNNTCNDTDDVTTDDCAPCAEFQSMIQTTMLFTCTGNATLAKQAVYMATLYKNKWQRALSYEVRQSVRSADLVFQFILLFSNASIQHILLVDQAEEAARVSKEVNIFNMEETYPLAEKKRDLLIQELEEMARVSAALVNLTVKYGMDNIFLVPFYRRVLNATTYLENRDIAKTYVLSRKFLESGNIVLFKLWPALMCVVFLVGIAGNGLLVVVFVRHADLRTVYNVMLENLVFTDIISLIFNLPLDYALTSRSWDFGETSCQSYLFLKTLTIGVSTYSLVILSYQRWSAVRAFSTSKTSKMSSAVMVLILWVCAIIYSSPSFYFGTVRREGCGFERFHLRYKVICDFVVLCVVPLIVVAIFSTMASNALKKSVQNMPGERMGQEKRMHDRMVTSRVLIGLVVLSVVSYVPKYLLELLLMTTTEVHALYFNFNNPNWLTYITISFLVEVALYLNSALSPVVLYFLSTKFKSYFNIYLFCKFRSKA